MSNLGYLALMLDAPLMSWGVSSRFQRRTTELHPSRSALCGMFCAAMGLDKGSGAESAALARLEKVTFTFYTIARSSPDRDKVLAIQRMEDFHTVSGTRSADNPRPKKDAVLTHRQYLLDARFAVMLCGDAEWLHQIAAALRDPVWGVWFGRKSCIPALPLVPREVRRSKEEALADVGLAPDSAATLRAVHDSGSFSEGTDTVMDVPVNFKTRSFKPRRIERRPAASG